MYSWFLHLGLTVSLSLGISLPYRDGHTSCSERRGGRIPDSQNEIGMSPQPLMFSSRPRALLVPEFLWSFPYEGPHPYTTFTIKTQILSWLFWPLASLDKPLTFPRFHFSSLTKGMMSYPMRDPVKIRCDTGFEMCNYGAYHITIWAQSSLLWLGESK